MYTDISLWLSLVFVIGGLAALAWSSDMFVDGAAALAKLLGISPFIIGMVIIGFGTSAPELCVSAMAGAAGHSDLSLGNAYGSCNFNIAVILGVAVMIFPLVVKPAITYVAGPGLTLISLFSFLLLKDGTCSRTDGIILLLAFAVILPLYCWFDQWTSSSSNHKTKKTSDQPQTVESVDAEISRTSKFRGAFAALMKTVVGLSVLISSSHFLVWGAVDLAKSIGVSDLVIGLTIVAAGTSLPELASAIASARRGEHEFVLGNIIGSNLFNTLAVVGLATTISPTSSFSPYIITRDLPVMAALSLSISFFGVNWRHFRWPGAIQYREALLWLIGFAVYTVVMFLQEVKLGGC